MPIYNYLRIECLANNLRIITVRPTPPQRQALSFQETTRLTLQALDCLAM